MIARALAAAVVLSLVLGACGDDGGGGDDPGADQGGAAGDIGVPVEIGDLTVTVDPPVRGTFPETIEVEVAFDVTGTEPVPVPDPVLTCNGSEFEIDHDAARYPTEIDLQSYPDVDDGRWAWSPGADCEAGSFDVDGVVFTFDSVAPG